MAEEESERQFFTEKDTIFFSSTFFGVFFGVHVSQLFLEILGPTFLFRPWVIPLLGGYSNLWWVRAIFSLSIAPIAIVLIYLMGFGLLPSGQPKQCSLMIKKALWKTVIWYGVYCFILSLFLTGIVVLCLYGIIILVGWLFICLRIIRRAYEQLRELREELSP